MRHNVNFQNNRSFIPYLQFLFTTKAQRIIEEHAKGAPSKPLFLYLPYQNVHAPLQVPSQYSDLYPDERNQDRKIFSGAVKFPQVTNV